MRVGVACFGGAEDRLRRGEGRGGPGARPGGEGPRGSRPGPPARGAAWAAGLPCPARAGRGGASGRPLPLPSFTAPHKQPEP